MLKRLNKCPLCKSGHFLNYQTIKDFSVSQEDFILCHCQECNLIFTNPRPGKKSIAKYYEFDEYYSHSDDSNSLISKIYNQVRQINIKKKYKLISSLGTDKSILDIGCGTGELLKFFQSKNWKVSGIEPSKTARKLAEEKLKVQIDEKLENIPSSEKFDIITLFHVLEHVHGLRKAVKSVINLLKSDGYILIALPNHQSPDALKYKEYWAGWDVPRHLYHFDTKSFDNLANKFNLQIVERYPMTFDSYYVSLLSEKYLNPENQNLTSLAKSFISGLNSNLKAKESGNYSSILYILKKK
ncbi:class I SAM-dependent methyltransferase [Algoriphagus formosus]|uniref:Class I SAM-dependent methyltransferase n=1 Tax=Algoriphagus formosus TaxID=2007308 RepID=A0A4R5UXN9_9BACT|nr:class I SAM-dependent methyltransferase [Algoriphagus aquimaris]TDK44123.1 class I SAM-dependent methyltransferase [Algoriphagus aquimaris]